MNEWRIAQREELLDISDRDRDSDWEALLELLADDLLHAGAR